MNAQANTNRMTAIMRIYPPSIYADFQEVMKLQREVLEENIEVRNKGKQTYVCTNDQCEQQGNGGPCCYVTLLKGMDAPENCIYCAYEIAKWVKEE